ncbi:hypothetical protein GCM10009801_71620 [Streptomyces albiaxialis]|uniref:CBS domain-containing protein n=1 Tax=Streptomyces albiaxialis TaxID=329523 RepID=A0ABN2WW13_9ACTN
MEPGPRRDIKDATNSPLSQQIDEEITLALCSLFPVDKGVPLLDEAGDVLLGVVAGFPDLNGVVSEFLSRSRGNDETSCGRDGGLRRGHRGRNRLRVSEPRAVSDA